MALILAADVVDHQLVNYLESHGITQHFGTQERILVCITARADAHVRPLPDAQRGGPAIPMKRFFHADPADMRCRFL